MEVDGDAPFDVVDDEEETARKFNVRISKAAGFEGVVLHGECLRGTSWGGSPIEGTPLHPMDAFLVLGAAGVEESEAIAKMAVALDPGAADQRVRARREVRGPGDISVDLGMLKFAAGFSGAAQNPDVQERFLALQFLGNRTLEKAMDNLPALQQFIDDVAIIALSSQIGYGGVDESVAYQAMKNLQELLSQLELVKRERDLASAESLRVQSAEGAPQ